MRIGKFVMLNFKGRLLSLIVWWTVVKVVNYRIP